MNYYTIIFFVSFFIISKSFAGYSSIENNFSYSFFNASQDSIIIDSNKIIPLRNANKSPINAMLYSSILPGAGQAYLGKWYRAFLFLAIEGVAIGVHYQNNSLASKKKEEYILYANNHWDFNRWIHDYYYWYEEGDDQWNGIREVFINTDDDYYFDIWDHSHSIKFVWYGSNIAGDVVSSSNEDVFKDIYIELCGITTSLNNPLLDNYSPQCINNVEQIKNITEEKLRHIKDHHFFEGIQKYDMFFAGWDDAKEDAEVITIGNNIIITSPSQSNYQNIYSDYNKIKKLAKRAGEYILINHFVSLLDAFLLSRISNNNKFIKLDLEVYPNLKNFGGIGTFNIKMEMK